MKLLFTGNGTAGSWHCRGDQIGNALGATVKPNATSDDMRRHDLTVVVKRVPAERLEALRASKRPWVYDIVDPYPQPDAGDWEQGEAIRWTRDLLKRLAPNGVIWPNRRMMEDVGFDGPQAVVYHHHRPGIRINPVRKDVRVIGYEGAAAYIEPWRAHIEAECDKRGWSFVVNPDHLAELDIVLALRGGRWNGYVQQHWKSNVKLANAHGSGTPFVGSPESGYEETRSGCEYWARDLGSLRMAFDWLTDIRTRKQVSDRFRERAYSLQAAAKDYGEFLCGSKFS